MTEEMVLCVTDRGNFDDLHSYRPRAMGDEWERRSNRQYRHAIPAMVAQTTSQHRRLALRVHRHRNAGSEPDRKSPYPVLGYIGCQVAPGVVKHALEVSLFTVG